MCMLMVTHGRGAAAEASVEAPPRSPMGMVVSVDGNLYVAESTARAIAMVDLNHRRVTGRIALPANPTGLAIAPGGDLIVTAGQVNGQVLRVDPQTGSVAVLMDRLHSPTAPVFDPRREVVYVADRFRSRVLSLNAQGELVGEFAVSREPCRWRWRRTGRVWSSPTNSPRDGPIEVTSRPASA